MPTRGETEKKASIFCPGWLRNIPYIQNVHARLSNLLFRSLKSVKLSTVSLLWRFLVPSTEVRGRPQRPSVVLHAARQTQASGRESPTLWTVPTYDLLYSYCDVTSAQSYALTETQWNNWSWLDLSRTQRHCVCFWVGGGGPPHYCSVFKTAFKTHLEVPDWMAVRF